MRIGMVLPTRFPPDIRVEKEARSLIPTHRLSLLCVRRGDQAEVEDWQGVEVQRVFSPLERWWNAWSMMRTCGSPAWGRAMDRFVRECGIEALHIHDLPLLGPGLAVARRHGIPVVADLHENYPAMLAESLKGPWSRVASAGNLVARLSVSVPRWAEYERRVVPLADSVIVVIEEAAERLERLGVDPARITVVGNYSSLDAETPAARDDSKRFRVVYAGGFGATRDLRTVVDAAAICAPDIGAGFEVVLVGGRGKELQDLERYARAVGVGNIVSIRAWMPQTEAERLMTGADVGLVPHVKSPHTDATIPHKLFQYMWRRLPVIVSDCRPLERIVSDARCGLVYPTGDAARLAAAIVSIHRDPEARSRMGAAGRAAVQVRYNWDRAAEALRGVYASLEATR